MDAANRRPILVPAVARKLTVVTPSFNQGKFIERTIRSVLDQGYPNLEYVIVDGGSTDESVEIIRRYSDRLAWWVSEPDEGQSHAINKGIEGTSGEIVAFINSDDYFMPGAFQKAIAAFERSEASWVVGASWEADSERQLGLFRPAPPSSSEGPIRGRHWWMLAPWHVPQPSSFWRRELFDRFGMFRLDMHYAFDAEFTLRLAFGGEMPELLPDEFLSTRFRHPAQKWSERARLWKPEIRRFVGIFRSQLTPRERRRLALIRVPAATYLECRDLIVHPMLRWGGELLENVPERWRPAIRTRDRYLKSI
jgi:glycosyltransferase involved in cell wall biosynthesis